jgi:hypothetical protein
VTFSFSSIFIITTKQGENTKQKQQTEMKIFNCVWLLQFFFFLCLLSSAGNKQKMVASNFFSPVGIMYDCH